MAVRRIAWLVVALAGCPGPEQVACEGACDVLATECAYEAYPSAASCVEGCLTRADLGDDVQAFDACVFEASVAADGERLCDPFAVMTCARASERGDP